MDNAIGAAGDAIGASQDSDHGDHADHHGDADHLGGGTQHHLTSLLEDLAPVPGHIHVDRNVAKQFLYGEIPFIPRFPYTRGREASADGTPLWTLEEVMVQTRTCRAEARNHSEHGNGAVELPPVGDWEKIV